MRTGVLAAHRKSIVCMYLLWAVIYAMANQAAHATFHTYRISELYSNVDGSVQFIDLKEAFGFNGQNFLAGHNDQRHAGTDDPHFHFSDESAKRAPPPVLHRSPRWA